MHKNSGNDIGLNSRFQVYILVRNAILFEKNRKTYM